MNEIGMKEGKRIGSSPKLKNVPELMQHIQSRLPVEAAARTSVLSKSWLHAWSTIPTLRFHVPNEQERKEMKLDYIDRTLIGYLRDNIPIEKFDLDIRIEKGESLSLAEKWIRSVATKFCLKELSLTIDCHGTFFNFPDEILSGENVTKLRVSSSGGGIMTSHNPPIINCVSLRELHLSDVRISQQVLDHILSSCSLLTKIHLKSCSQYLKSINVKSLPCLNELEILIADVPCCGLEIDNLPNLRLFSCNQRLRRRRPVPLNTHSISLGSSVTQLSLGGPGLVTDYASLDMIKSGFPFLESLTLNMEFWTLGSFHFTCALVKRISLLVCPNNLIDIQINALKLLFFRLTAKTMPTLSFPISTTLEKIKFQLTPTIPFGASFFLKMREALELLSNCYVHIIIHWNHRSPLEMDLLDDLKTRLQFPPAMNVQTLSFVTGEDKYLWKENSPFFDAFFEICHPKEVSAKLMMRKVLEKKKVTTANSPYYLKHVQTRTRRTKIWDGSSFVDGPAPCYADFKLEWCYS